MTEGLAMFAAEEEVPASVLLTADDMGMHRQELEQLQVRFNAMIERVTRHEKLRKDEDDAEVVAWSHEAVWGHLEALRACTTMLEETLEGFRGKIRESMEMQGTTMEAGEESYGDDAKAVENRDPAVPSEDSSEDESGDDAELPRGFQDVEPVTSKRVARELNDRVIQRVNQIFGDNVQDFEDFKEHALQFGTGNESAADFYGFLMAHMTDSEIESIILDFAKLLPREEHRIPLLRAHYAHLDTARSIMALGNSWSRRSDSVWSEKPRKSYVQTDADTEDSEDDRIDELPQTLRLRTVNHLVFIIHGIGEHVDFKEGEIRPGDKGAEEEGGNHSFRELFRKMLDTMFRDIPVALEMQSIEWHDEVHGPTGVDDIFELIGPEGSAGIRGFTKDTLMDVLYYMSPKFGQLIVDSVTKQLNEKYHTFVEEHPDYDGKVSIFAHSLGSVISYDLLTHERGEVARNGVRFPGLDFPVENFFGVGSPVPIMVLSRGELELENGHFVGGLKMPNCARYFNIFHPIDPIAYRVEPLINPEMRNKAPVRLISAHPMKTAGFAKVLEKLEELTSPVHGFPYRIDYVMKRRKREAGVMELAYASGSHSSYWMSDDVVLFTLMQICKPVQMKLQRYMSSQQPIPRLMPFNLELTPETRVRMSSKAWTRDRCTGFPQSRVVLMDRDRLFILASRDEVVCTRRWVCKLDTMKVTYGDDPFTMKVIPDGASSSPPASAGSSPSSQSTQCPEPFVFKAKTTKERDEWLNGIQRMILKKAAGDAQDAEARERPREVCHMIEIGRGKSVDYFGSVKVGFLQEKTPKGWYEGWNNRWLVLQQDQLSCFDSSPRLNYLEQFKLRKSKIFCYEAYYLFRIVSRYGTSLDLNVRDQAIYKKWVEFFSQVRTAVVVHEKNLLDTSPALILLGERKTSTSEVKEAWLETRVERFRLETDDKGTQYAAFAIDAVSPTLGSNVVHRRHSEFERFHNQLHRLIPHDQVPRLPGSRLWKKLDTDYLKEKTVLLNTYMKEVCQCCGGTIAGPTVLAFLGLATPVAKPKNGTSTP